MPRPWWGRRYCSSDDAILFHEPRQELHVVDTMAAIIWCYSEDGKGRAADALVADFGIDGG